MDFKIKHPKYYVGIQTKRGLELVTSVDYTNKMWYAEHDKEPMTFTKKLAEELVICCEMNFTPAVVIYTSQFIHFRGQPFINKESK